MAFPLPANLLYSGLLAFCLLLGLGLLLMGWRRPHRRQRGARMAAGAVATGALWLTAYPPLRSRPVARAEAILLTEGYQPDSLRQLRQRLGPGAPVWYYGLAPAGPAPAGARPLASLLSLAEERPALRRLHVLGQGLPPAELPTLGAVAVQWHPGAAFTGFRTAVWPQKLTLGEVLHVEGQADLAPGAAPAWVGLRATGAVRDSARVPAGGGPFRLRYQPKTAGLAQYELVLRRPGQLPIRESLPLEITPPARPAVLLLSATPSFEFKFLKNHLAEAGYPVGLRTAVSRGLAQTDFVGQPARNLARLTPALLTSYAVLVADAATLAGLPGAEARALQAAVGAGRLGLLVLADNAPLPRAVPARADFAVLAGPPAPAGSLPPSSFPTQPLTWPDAPPGARAPVPARLRPALALRALVRGPGGALAAASRRVGLGFVVVSVVPETFRWALQGQAPVYASFWNRLLTAAGPPAPAAATWRLGSRWPRPFEPLTLHLAAALPPANRPTAGPGPETAAQPLPTARALAGGPAVRLALRQDSRLPEWYTAQFWPGAAGWHEVRGPGRTRHRFYVYPAAVWPGPARTERQLALAQRMVIPTPPQPSDLSAASTPEPWPAAWFFGLFLLAAGYLWLEEKL